MLSLVSFGRTARRRMVVAVTLSLAVALGASAQQAPPIVVPAPHGPSPGASTVQPTSPAPSTVRAPRAGAPVMLLTATEISGRAPARLSEVLRVLPGIRIAPAGAAGWAATGRSLPDRCYAQVYVDRVRMTGPGTPEPFDIDQIPVSVVERIEIYLGPSTVPASIPQGEARCGLVLIRTHSHTS